MEVSLFTPHRMKFSFDSRWIFIILSEVKINNYQSETAGKNEVGPRNKRKYIDINLRRKAEEDNSQNECFP